MRLKSVAATIAIAALATLGINHVRLNVHAAEAMKFRDVSAWAYYRYGVMPDSIVLDIRSVEGGSSAAATIGGLIAFAEALSERQFREVVLASGGRAKFILSGEDFRQMGREASFQNPVYTIRTLPAKLRRPDGSHAYSRWSGGLIGVLGAQMDDVNRFARDWYISDALKRF